MKTPGIYLKGLVMAILFFFLAGRLVMNAQTTLPDSLIFQGANLDIGEKFRTGYYTSFYHYAINSYFKESNGNEHLAYVDNYKLYYFKSTDNGINWVKEQIITAKEGDIFSCALTVDTVGKVFIGITVNNNFNYSNPTAVGAGSEFYYDLYCVNNKTGSWVTELVNTHSAGNFGPRVTGLFVDANNKVHMIANYYGWQSFGGTAWEWIRNATSNTWGATITIVKFTDTPIDRSIFDTYSIVPDQQGNVTLVMCRNISTPNTQKTRLFYVRHNVSSWSAPVTITDSVAVAWNRFDALVDTTGHTYIAFLKNTKSKIPELKIIRDFGPAQTAVLNLAAGDTLNYFRIHCNAKGLFTLYLYLNTKNQKIKISFSKDAVKWTDPIPTPTDLNNYLGGMIVKTDTRRGYFTDYCKQITTVGQRISQPYGPDELFYGSIRLLEIPSTPALLLPANAALINAQGVSFQWTSSIPEVTHYRMQIDVTPEFLDPIADTAIAGTTFLFDQARTGKYYWRVKAKNQRGWGAYGEPNWYTATFVSMDEAQPSAGYSLDQNRPNPFNSITTILFSIPDNSYVTLKVFSANGKEVATLVNGYKVSGKHESRFDASSLQCGVYFYTLQAGNFLKTQKMILIK